MKRQADTIFLLCVCLLLSALVREQVNYLQKQWEKKSREMQERTLTPTHTSSLSLLEIIGGGVRPMIADFYWIKATTLNADEIFAMQRDRASSDMPQLVAQGSVRRTKRDNLELYELLRNTTIFDPSFEYAYYYGSHLLAFDGNTDLAVSLLQYGISKNPRSSVIPSTLAFVYFYFLGDWREGARYAKIAYKNKGATSNMYKEVANLYAAAQDYKGAIQFLQDVIASTSDPATRAQIEEQLKYLMVEDQIAFLQKAVDIYIKVNRRPPPDMERLVTLRVINKLPKEPFGGVYTVDDQGKVVNKPYRRFEHYQNMRKYIPQGGVRTQ